MAWKSAHFMWPQFCWPKQQAHWTCHKLISTSSYHTLMSFQKTKQNQQTNKQNVCSALVKSPALEQLFNLTTLQVTARQLWVQLSQIQCYQPWNIVYRIYSNKRRPWISATFGTKKVNRRCPRILKAPRSRCGAYSRASTWVVISHQKYHDMFLEKRKRDIFWKC